jgi:very-long-chain ceramide synthase
MPKLLGGSGDYSQVFKNHPYAEHAPYLKEYYLMVSTYHVNSIIQHLTNKRENDFVEMLFHHSITLYLMFGSYMMNVLECGAVISFLHDFPDCFVMAVKLST